MPTHHETPVGQFDERVIRLCLADDVDRKLLSLGGCHGLVLCVAACDREAPRHLEYSSLEPRSLRGAILGHDSARHCARHRELS